jgi:dihydroorotase
MVTTPSTEELEIRLGEQLRALRLRRNVDQQTLATNAGVALSALKNVESGKGVHGYVAGKGSNPEWPCYHSHFKMNPPLRGAADREAVLEGLTDGTIEVLCSDHAPHCNYEKEVEFDYAPFGITGLETELALSLMQLVHAGRLSLPEVLAKFTEAPARILKLPKGTLGLGADGDVTVIDPDLEWVYDAGQSASKCNNTPFDGWPLKGKAVMTILAGTIIWQE